MPNDSTLGDDSLVTIEAEAMPQLAQRLLRLRDQYVTATPRQRLAKARQRIVNAHAYPNQLVTHVSAVEGVARTLLMHERATTKDQLRAVYSKYKNREAHTLVAEYLACKGFPNPAAYIGEEEWQQFRHAVNYRNLLVHECTYLGLEKFDLLVNGCNAVLAKLAQIAGLEAGERPGG
jgi:hypothetical protein